MQTTRLLFPFTHGMQANAIEQAVQLAKSRNATLVPASLICVSKEREAKGPRLEYVQQSKDFLEAVSYRALKRNVPVEQVEVQTSDVVQCIDTLARELDCEGVLLFMHGKDCLLLESKNVTQIMQKVSRKLYVFNLKAKDSVSLQVC